MEHLVLRAKRIKLLELQKHYKEPKLEFIACLELVLNLCEMYYSPQDEVRSIELLRKGTENIMHEDGQAYGLPAYSNLNIKLLQQKT